MRQAWLGLLTLFALGLAESWLSPPALARVFPVRPAPQSEAALLLSFEDGLGARLASLAGARESIRIQSYIFHADEQGRVIAELLKKKRAEGKTVQVIVDASTTLYAANQAFYADLVRHGIDVQGYEPSFDHLKHELQTGQALDVHKRFHEKMWIIDAEREDGLAIVGGRNLLNIYFGLIPEKNHWKLDVDVLLRGPSVKDVAASFERNRAYFQEMGLNAASTGDEEPGWLSKKLSQWLVPAPAPSAMDLSILAKVDRIRAHASLSQFRFEPASVQIVHSNSRFGERDIARTYHGLLRTAKNIEIVNGLFLPRDRLLEDLRSALRRGARVRILTNSLENTLYPTLVLAGRYAYQELYDVLQEPEARSRGASLEIFEWTGPGMIHAKVAVFDGATAVVGSYNLDPRSELYNGEIVAVLRSQVHSQQLLGHLQSNFFRKSRLVTRALAEQYRHPDTTQDWARLQKALLLAPLE